jgi:predicted metal-binding protein
MQIKTCRGKMRETMKHVRSSWTDVVLVCRKCSKRLGGGFGDDGKTRLAKVLRAGFAIKKKKKMRKAPLGILEIDCLDVCPKNGVTALRAGAPEAWVVIPKGASVAEAAKQLGLNPPPE